MIARSRGWRRAVRLTYRAIGGSQANSATGMTCSRRARPVHMIFGARTRANNCQVIEVMSWNPLVAAYEWSGDNSAQIERGWVVKADTLAEFATRLGSVRPQPGDAAADRAAAAVRSR
jgi:hypothetical protein